MLDLDDIADAWSNLPAPPLPLLVDLNLDDKTITLEAVAVNRWLWKPLAAIIILAMTGLTLGMVFSGPLMCLLRLGLL